MQVVLSWASVPNAIYYNIYRSPILGGPYILIGQSNPNPGKQATNAGIVTTYTDGPGTLTNGQTYGYRITAVTADGESVYSSPETVANPPAMPAAPTGITTVIT